MTTSLMSRYHREDGFGIRHENLMVRKSWKTEYGQFMCFEFLLWHSRIWRVVPELMSVRERNLLNTTMHRYMRRFLRIWNEEEKNG